MNRGAVQVLAWGIYLAVLTTILWIWWGNWLPLALLGGAAVVIGLIALGFTLVHRRGPLGDVPPELRERRALPDISVGAALVGIALCGMLYGAEFGLSLVLISGGLLLLGVAQLAIELRAERRQRGGEDV